MSSRRVSRGRLHVARIVLVVVAGALIAAGTSHLAGQTAASGWKVVAWNNLGMHCMDADFSVFAILPPYNTIQAQVIDANGRLATGASGIRVTYQGVGDPDGSINTTARGKTNFWSYVLPLFGVSLPVDVGLPHDNKTANTQSNMPGASNAPQPMAFDANLNWFIAEGIPITPYDDAGRKNYYPLMKVTAVDSTGAPLATTNIVLPVSDEMDCTTCHASGAVTAARPTAGWVNDPDAQRDFRFNILRLHDDRQLGSASYASALQAKGYSASGLYATAAGGTAVLCANCHKSEALAGSGITGISPLTSAMHTLHAKVTDPTNGQALGSSANRSACYRCHPGSETRCLRGAMGNAVASDGSMAIQCQNCHGAMSAVGSPSRTGWLEEPTCQSCHTGTATQNAGAIRYTSVFDASGQTRVTTNATFATSPDTPAPGFSLYRFSSGHGGLQCSACHGSTHAEYPSAHRNDNLQSVATQGHVGTIAECTACHGTSLPTLTLAGPHGMHPVGASWVTGHHDAINGNLAQCQACHGTDYRGTVLSRAFAARTISSELGTKQLFRGAQVGCYMCHNGPSSSGANPNRPAVASNRSASTTSPKPVAIPLSATDPDGNTLTLRIVSQPGNGSVGLSGATATYFPYAGFSGTDTFTYAAWDGAIDSNLATVTVTVAAGAACTVTPTASAPTTATAGVPVVFSASTATANCAGTATYDWDFGDGSVHATSQSPSHAYTAGGTFHWTLTATVAGVSSAVTGSITVSGTAACTVTTTASAPGSATVGTAVAFSSTATASNCTGSVAYDWNFGDGSAHATVQNPTHTYGSTGTFSWTMVATIAGVASTKSGTIAVSSPQTPAPVITKVRQLSNPFEIEIDGANFASAVSVFIGADTTPWPTVRRSSDRLILGGGGLSERFPRRQAVTIRVENPDGQSVTTTFTRR